MNYLYIMNWVFLSLVIQNSQDKDYLANTEWQSKISNDCIDWYKFDLNYKVRVYSCELNDISQGDYKIVKNTVIVLITEKLDYNKADRWRYKFILRNKSLMPIATEEWFDNKWQKQKIPFDDKNVFVKVKSK